jgi:pimeloyl-ACP methyl ester carboxylesterase/protein-tyrosine phosphatase
VFFRNHPQSDKLPNSPPLPLLVFVHGLGGSLSQFSELLTGFVNTAPCLAFDLPGCGLSKLSPTSWDAYTIPHLVELIQTIVEKYRDAENDQRVLFVGHSMGCSLSVLCTSRSSPFAGTIQSDPLGLIAICPPLGPVPETQKSAVRKLLWVPNWMFNLWRLWDRRRGINSPSVVRYVGRNADLKTRLLQVRYNSQSRTLTLRRMLGGLVEHLPGVNVWEGLNGSVFLLGGAIDETTKPENVAKIAAHLRQSPGPYHVTSTDISQIDQDTEYQSSVFAKPPVLKVSIIPEGTHGMMYSTSTIRIVSGLISEFLASHVDERLSMGWQLQHLTTEGKWDVKNLAKWQAVAPVSGVIGRTFRVLKTLREVDELHNPHVFGETWHYDGKQEDMISDVVDISHDVPVYDPRGLEANGISYHKFPTVSKYPPTPDEVAAFVELIDGIINTRMKEHPFPNPKSLIGVHCHYGFNRSGFFVVSYMVERLGYTLQEALDEFATMRPSGIRHAHFIDTLFVRYTAGLRRSSVVE